MPKSSLREASVVTPALLPALAGPSLYFVPAMTLVTALATWQAIDRFGFPLWSVWFAGGFSALFTAGLIWVVFNAFTSFGVVATDRGVLYLDRAVRRGVIIQYGVPWDSLHDPTVTTGWFGQIAVRSLEVELRLDRKQARAVLLDPRCPLRAALPVDVAKWMNDA